MFSGILQRNTIQLEIQAILPHIFNIFTKELSMIDGIACKILNAQTNRFITVLPYKDNCPEIFIKLMTLQAQMKRCNALLNVQLETLISTL